MSLLRRLYSALFIFTVGILNTYATPVNAISMDVVEPPVRFEDASNITFVRDSGHPVAVLVLWYDAAASNPDYSVMFWRAVPILFSDRPYFSDFATNLFEETSSRLQILQNSRLQASFTSDDQTRRFDISVSRQENGSTGVAVLRLFDLIPSDPETSTQDSTSGQSPAPVPLPASIWFMLCSISGVFLVRKRKLRNQG